MGVEGNDKVKQVFLEAASLPRGERAAYLKKACAADDSLRREVESLLDADEGAEGFFPPPPELPTSGNGQGWDPKELLGSSVGPYRLMEVLGEGGFGAVYLAQEDQPIRRQVALKVLKPGLGSRQVVARFKAEMQALALMNHPGVAKVFDAGSTPQGMPYFAMEHVPGKHITRFCDDARMGLAERLDLFMGVCEAVQHAHQKGIIHRDLKPSNVLVMVQDQRPLPKVIDFGIAKAVGPRLTEETLSTTPGQLIGSPQYMSPEQAALEEGKVDTRTDIHGLGLLLYELLTGCRPFDFPRDVGLLEVLRRIREDPPPRPSLRVNQLDDSQQIELNRGSSRKALVKQLRGELDWIVAKVIEKDRGRRYPTASELAEDISRHVQGEPVTAGPPSAGYRLKKLVTRHKWAVAGVSALILGLACGFAVSTGFYILAEERLQDVIRLTDTRVLKQYKVEADHLWPAVPATIPALEAWLSEIREMEGRFSRYRRDLDELRRKALPYTEELRARDLKNHPQARYLAELKEYLAVKKEKFVATLPSNAESEMDVRVRANLVKNIARAEDLIPKLEVEVRERLSWEFQDPKDRRDHDLLAEMLQEWKTFSNLNLSIGTLGQVESRLEFARTVRQRTIDDRAADWQRAIAAISASTRYGGLKIKPQLGLIPLGEDPSSNLWEFAHLQSGVVPLRGADQKLQVTEETGLVFVLIPGATFDMGARGESPEYPPDAPNVDLDANVDQSPVHAVTLKPFFISKYEMSQAQWVRFTRNNPSMYGPDQSVGGKPLSLLHPVETVSWTACIEVLHRLALMLPTEAQWECAARGGTSTVWPTGNDRKLLQGAANVADSFFNAHSGMPGMRYDADLDDGYPAHAPVDSFLPNKFGLHGVIGNVWEWCRDIYGRYWTAKVAPGDGEHRHVGIRPHRVVRGGSYADQAVAARVANRYGHASNYTNAAVGVRPARALEE